MDVRKLLKVYNYVNNEKRPKVNLKFAGALVAFLSAGALLVGFLVMNDGAPNGSTPGANAGTCPSQTEYVGLDPNDAGSLSTSSLRADSAYAEWQRSHDGWKVEKKEPVSRSGIVIGYLVTASPPSC